MRMYGEIIGAKKGGRGEFSPSLIATSAWCFLVFSY